MCPGVWMTVSLTPSTSTSSPSERKASGIGWWFGGLAQPEGAGASDIYLLRMEQESGAGGALNAPDTQDVVDVAVGVGDKLDVDTHVSGESEDLFGLISRVHDDSLPGAPGTDDPAVFGERTNDDASNHEFGHLGLCHSTALLSPIFRIES